MRHEPAHLFQSPRLIGRPTVPLRTIVKLATCVGAVNAAAAGMFGASLEVLFSTAIVGTVAAAGAMVALHPE